MSMGRKGRRRGERSLRGKKRHTIRGRETPQGNGGVEGGQAGWKGGAEEGISHIKRRVSLSVFSLSPLYHSLDHHNPTATLEECSNPPMHRNTQTLPAFWPSIPSSLPSNTERETVKQLKDKKQNELPVLGTSWFVFLLVQKSACLPFYNVSRLICLQVTMFQCWRPEISFI